MTAVLKERYDKTVKDDLRKQFSYGNVMQIPKLEKIVTVALPRIRDFQGVPDKSFDGRGNYSLGLKEQLVFPEIEYDKIDRLRGMEITICTTARTDEEARALLRNLGMPFRTAS